MSKNTQPESYKRHEVRDGLGEFKTGRQARVVRAEDVTAKVPAVVLYNPKYPHNVGQTIRAASCYGVNQVWYTGNRVPIEAHAGFRLPREERMRGYKDVDLFQYERPLDLFARIGATPVAVEVRENAEPLHEFEHPENAVYVFGPEDGSIPPHILGLCHRFVVIPTLHCLNLASAVGTVLYDRGAKLGFAETAGYNTDYGNGHIRNTDSSLPGMRQDV